MSKINKKTKHREPKNIPPPIVDLADTMQEKEERKTDDLSLQGLAKDPDLSDEIEAIHHHSICPLLGVRWAVSNYKHILDTVRQTQSQPGNTIYQWWLDRTEYYARWGNLCFHYNDDFIDHPDNLSWEEKAVRFYENCDNNIPKMEKEAARILDFRLLLDEGTPAADADWETRTFLFGLAPQCPLTCLGFGDDTDADDESKYWNKWDVLESWIKMAQNPLTLVWLIAASHLGHPWAAVDSESETSVPDAFEDLEAKKAAKKARKRAAPSADVIDLASHSGPGSYTSSSSMEQSVAERPPVDDFDEPPIKQLAFSLEPSDNTAPTSATTEKQIVKFSKASSAVSDKAVVTRRPNEATAVDTVSKLTAISKKQAATTRKKAASSEA